MLFETRCYFNFTCGSEAGSKSLNLMTPRVLAERLIFFLRPVAVSRTPRTAFCKIQSLMLGAYSKWNSFHQRSLEPPSVTTVKRPGATRE